MKKTVITIYHRDGAPDPDAFLRWVVTQAYLHRDLYPGNVVTTQTTRAAARRQIPAGTMDLKSWMAQQLGYPVAEESPAPARRKQG